MPRVLRTSSYCHTRAQTPGKSEMSAHFVLRSSTQRYSWECIHLPSTLPSRQGRAAHQPLAAVFARLPADSRTYDLKATRDYSSEREGKRKLTMHLLPPRFSSPLLLSLDFVGMLLTQSSSIGYLSDADTRASMPPVSSDSNIDVKFRRTLLRRTIGDDAVI